MADQMSPEETALNLLDRIAEAESIRANPHASSTGKLADRAWILSTYAECIRVVKTGKFSPSGG